MPKTIEITIEPTGKSTVKTEGYTGSSCQDASKFIERALGKIEADKKTPEFYQTDSNQISNKQ